MNASKSQLLAATAVASLFASTGAIAAPAVYSATEIRGNGASAVAVVAVKELNCLGNAVNQNLGLGTGATQNIAEHLYQPVSPSLSNPTFDCGTGAFAERSVQPNITGYYISTGSSAGRNNFVGFVGTNGITTNPFGTWTNIQYAFSEGPLSTSNITTYNSTAVTSPVSNGAGAAIQVPFYVVPITLAYAPVYGKRDTGTGVVNLAFNVKTTFVSKDGAGLPVGGLRMKKTTYCGIMNGTITNWNDAALTADNGGQSLRDPADDLTRWNATGVPIKLVGRSDGSGSTSLFTRHLDALGGGTGDANIVGCVGGQLDTNVGGTDALPAGAISTAVYDSTTGALTGTEVAGKFGRTNGSNGVAATVGQAIATPGALATTLGGYLGYVGADWVLPSTVASTTPALFSAALQVGTSTAFAMPTAINASKSFGTTYLPPQSASTGKYAPLVTANGARNNPIDWVLPANAKDRLANPIVGYPIVGTSNLLMYTCYSTPEKRLAMHAFASLHFGKITKDSTDAKVPALLVGSTAKGADLYPVGLLSRNGLASLPTSWKNAILETFFTKTTSGANPSTLNLWVQDKLPTTAALVSSVVGNSTCSGTTGG